MLALALVENPVSSPTTTRESSPSWMYVTLGVTVPASLQMMSDNVLGLLKTAVLIHVKTASPPGQVTSRASSSAKLLTAATAADQETSNEGTICKQDNYMCTTCHYKLLDDCNKSHCSII